MSFEWFGIPPRPPLTRYQKKESRKNGECGGATEEGFIASSYLLLLVVTIVHWQLTRGKIKEKNQTNCDLLCSAFVWACCWFCILSRWSREEKRRHIITSGFFPSPEDTVTGSVFRLFGCLATATGIKTTEGNGNAAARRPAGCVDVLSHVGDLTFSVNNGPIVDKLWGSRFAH